MSSASYYHIILSGFILLALTACGQNYVVQKYYGTPYGGDRTAGSGVEYVRANLAPPKGLEMDLQQQQEIDMQNNASMIPSKSFEKVFNDFVGKEKSFKLITLRTQPDVRYNP